MDNQNDTATARANGRLLAGFGPHKPASEVFKIEQATEAKTERLQLDAFLAEVGSSTLDVSSTGSVIEHIRSRDDITPRVRKRAIAILEAAE